MLVVKSELNDNNPLQTEPKKLAIEKGKKRLDNYTSLIDALIKAETIGKPQHEKIVFVSKTPAYLIETAGFPDLPLVIIGKTVSKAHFDHGIALSLLKRLPEVVENPHALFKSQSQMAQAGSVVILTLEMKGSSPIVVPIRPSGEVGARRSSEKANIITSVYAKEGPNPLAKWTAAGLLLWKP